MKRYFHLALMIFAALNSFAQDKDLLSVNYGLSGFQYHDTAAIALQTALKCALPVYRKNKHSIVGVMNYKNTAFYNFPESYRQTLHGFTLQAIWIYKMSGNKSIALFAQTGLFSDLQEISIKDFRYTAGFRYRYKHSGRLSTGWGLAYSRQFFGNQLVPFIDVDYKPGRKWSITGQFPIKPKILYHLNKKLSVGVEINGDAASYRLSASDKNNRFIQINQWTGFTKMEYQFSGGWQLNLGIGRNFSQSFKLYNDASSTSWTIITIPIGEKSDPVQRIDNRGFRAVLGISLQTF